MAGLDDILTTQKNGVTSLNNLNQTWLRGQGTVTSNTVTANTSIVVGKGYLASISVVTNGSTSGKIYNTTSNASASVSNSLYTIPTTNGVYTLGFAYTSGIYIVPGTGQAVNVTYTPAS